MNPPTTPRTDERTTPSARVLSDSPANAIPLKLSRLCGYLVLFKLSYLLLLSVAMLAWPLDKHARSFHASRQEWTPDGHLTFASHFGSWDAEHYLFIAAQGYEAGAGRCAFYPLFPLTIRCFSILTGGNYLIAGMILANAFSLAGWLIFFQIVRKRLDESIAKLSLVLLLAFPGSLFFQFIYSESLFLLLLMLLVFSLDEDRWVLACVAAFLLPLTRAVGIFSVVPVFWYLFFKAPPLWLANLTDRNRWIRKAFSLAAPKQAGRTPTKSIPASLPGRNGRYWLLLTPVYGWSLYFLLMWKWTGNPFEGFDAQKQFGLQSTGNLFDLPHFISELVTPRTFHEVYGSIVDRGAFVLLLWCLPIIWRLDKGWFLWALFLGVVPSMSGMFVSYTRFASVVFPLFVALAVFLNRSGVFFRALRLFAILAFSVLQAILVWRFVNYRWAG